MRKTNKPARQLARSLSLVLPPSFTCLLHFSREKQKNPESCSDLHIGPVCSGDGPPPQYHRILLTAVCFGIKNCRYDESGNANKAIRITISRLFPHDCYLNAQINPSHWRGIRNFVTRALSYLCVRLPFSYK